jgi:hypothetical protein
VSALPFGCLSCNPTDVKPFLIAQGLDPNKFKQVPKPKHRWKDVMHCDICDAYFITLSSPVQNKKDPALDDAIQALKEGHFHIGDFLNGKKLKT